MADVAIQYDLASNPIDLIEDIAGDRDWLVDRSTADEVNLIVAGSWCDLHLSMNWHEEMEGLHLACTFDLKVPQNRREEVCRVITMINEQLFYGHFDLWRSEGVLLFRHSALLTGGASVTMDQCDGMLAMMLKNAEQFYPVFQFVIWAGKSAEEAMQASMLETVGEA